MSLPPDYAEAQRQLVSAKSGDDLIRIFDDLVKILALNDEISATIEFCSDALRRADELALTAEEWLNVAISLMEALRRTGLVHQALQLADQVYARVALTGQTSSMAVQALTRIAVVATNADDLNRARDLLEEAAKQVASGNDLRGLAIYSFSRGIFNLRVRRVDLAICDYETSASAYSILGEAVNHAMAVGQKARAQMVAGYLRLARDSFESVIATEPIPRRFWATIATNYAICLMYRGDWEYALSLLSRAEQDAKHTGIYRDEWRIATIRGLIASRQGRTEDAAAMAQIASEQAKKSGRLRDQIAALECLGETEYERGNFEKAIEIYTECIERGEAVGMSDATTEGKRREAEAWIALGEYDKALAAATRAIEVATAIEDRYEHSVAHRPLAVAHSMLGHESEAAEVFRRGIEEMRALGDPLELAKTLVEFASHLREWDPTTLALSSASEYLREAKELFTKLGVERWIKRTDDDLAEVIKLAEPESAEAVTAAPADQANAPDQPTIDLSRSSRTFGSVTFFTRAPDIHAMFERLVRVAPSNLPVLITGESGTGKELIARAILELSNRPEDRFVAINCAALPRELHESELFGHARGSFTGATAEKPGLFEMADGGTIFLDEIGDLELSAQGKLLRVLETGELRRVGEVKVRRVDARVVAATNRNLEQGARDGTFRSDLFHRLNGFPVRISSLRERPADIEILARHFLDFFQREYKKRVIMTPEILELYRSYRWPGNVRELRQEIHRMVLLTEDDTPMHARDSEIARLAAVDAGEAIAGSSGLAIAVEEHERRLIIDALQKTGGNKANAARLLNMSRTTLVGKVRRLGIE